MTKKNYNRISDLIKQYNYTDNRDTSSIFTEIVTTDDIVVEEVEEVNPYPSHIIHFKPDIKNPDAPEWEKRAYIIVDKLRNMNISAKNFKRLIYQELLVDIGKEIPKEELQ